MLKPISLSFVYVFVSQKKKNTLIVQNAHVIKEKIMIKKICVKKKILEFDALKNILK